MFRPDLVAKIRGDFLHLSELVFPAVKVGSTPSELVHEEKKLGFKLVRYRSHDNSQSKNKILFVPHIINRAYILDLNDDVSIVRGFCEDNFDVYLIDWGYPSLEHSRLSLFDNAQYVDQALSLISMEKVAILGYCTGGIISLINASLHPERVNSLILLATPVDFSKWRDPRILWGKVFDPRKVTLFFGNIPGEMINFIGFHLLAWQTPQFLTSREFLAELLTYESWRDVWRRVRWIIDAPAIPGGAYTEFIENCYQKNLLMKNKFKLGNHLVHLNRIDCPVLNILARYDHIVPMESAKALKEVYSGDTYQEIIFPSSHVGLTVSRQAHRDLWPKVREWLRSKN